MASIGPVVSEEKMFENVDGRTTDDDGRTTDAWLYYKLTYEPKGSGELKKWGSAKVPHVFIIIIIIIIIFCKKNGSDSMHAIHLKYNVS